MRCAPGDERPAPESSLGAAGRDPIAMARQAYRENEAEAQRAAEIVRHDPSFCASLAAGGEVHLARAPSVLSRAEALADFYLFLAGAGFVAVLFGLIVILGGRS
ncbi:hypothetical protein NS226_21115 [Aureimonas ureilytica]|uniref:Uncharacterized protein n=2 Tax=Aureimonas ureilytica TaxID=401562 RepID=A0A175R2Z4_9HYPH|nr:hypothetical protein NS226_21115 [Aureimonas ureilytica]